MSYHPLETPTKERTMDNEFFSPLTVAKKLGAQCVIIMMTYTFGWTAFVAWHEVRTGNHPDLAHTAIATANGVGQVAMLIVIYSIATTVLMDFLGGTLMVTARYLGNKFVQPLIERHKAEGRVEGRIEGREEGEAAERRRWTEWNSRRVEAERAGVPFDEPPPAS